MGPRFIEELKAQIPHVLNLEPAAAAPRLTAEGPRMLPLLAEGKTVRVMADELGLAPRSVDRRLRSVYEKLQASSSFEAGIKATKYGLI